jgi:uncharacterized protein (TIGR00255 family)
MPLASMTGFARATGAKDAYTWSWEIRCHNGRNLDIRCRLAAGFEALEPKVRRILSGGVNRGTCQVSLNMRKQAAAGDIEINQPALDAVLEAAGRLERDHGLAPARADMILALKGVLQTADTDLDSEGADALEAGVLASLETAVKDLTKARAAEGEQLLDILVKRVADIETLVATARSNPSQTPDAVAARLKAQIARLTEASDSLDEDRLHQEAALLATKADVTEEIDRLDSHIKAARDLFKDKQPQGRKLEFLVQEFNREANTLCSKSNDTELTRIGLELKAQIDQMREQVLNIE